MAIIRSTFPALPGWHAALLDRDAGKGIYFMPIAAWAIVGPDGLMVILPIVPFGKSVGVPAEEDLVGVAGPGDERLQHWQEVAEHMFAEELDAAKKAEAEALSSGDAEAT